MTSERRFKDAIRRFVDAPEPAAGDEAARVPEPGTDGAGENERQRLAMEFATTVDALIDMLNAECSAVRTQDLDALASFAESKEATLARLEAILTQARAKGHSLRERCNGVPAELRLARFDDAVRRNMAVIEAAKDAVLKVNGAMVKAVEAGLDDGVYGRQGHSLKPQEISTAGLRFEA